MQYFNHSLIFSVAYIFSMLNSGINVQAAGIKKWIDADGHIHYGDTPPRSIQTQIIKPTKRPSNLGKPLPRLKISDTSDDQTKSAPPLSTSLEPEQAKEICDAAKKDLSVIQNSTLIQLRSADGSLRYLSKDEIKQRQERSESDIEKFCK